MSTPSRVLLTTSRNPTPTIRTFCNNLAKVIPIVARVNRGKMNIEEVAEKASSEYCADRVVIIDRWQGGPGKIEFFHISRGSLVFVPPIIYVSGIRLQREFAPAELKPTKPLVITQSIDNSMQIVDSLSKFFNLPVLTENEALSKYQVVMRISHDATGRFQITFMHLPQKVEIGPRITVRRVAWETTK